MVQEKTNFFYKSFSLIFNSKGISIVFFTIMHSPLCINGIHAIYFFFISLQSVPYQYNGIFFSGNQSELSEQALRSIWIQAEALLHSNGVCEIQKQYSSEHKLEQSEYAQ